MKPRIQFRGGDWWVWDGVYWARSPVLSDAWVNYQTVLNGTGVIVLPNAPMANSGRYFSMAA